MKYLDKYPNCVGCPVKKWCGTMISCLRLCRSYKDNKEETKMDYKKRYNQAIEAAKRELHCCGSLDCDAARQIFRLFPELRESEDEKIRKEIIQSIKDSMCVIHKDKCLAWLEKQKDTNVLIQEASEKAYTEGMRVERKHWLEKQDKKSSWSEEDSKNLNSVKRIIENSENLSKIFETIDSPDYIKKYFIDWLKSIKPQNRWKPSEEQMSMLLAVLNDSNNITSESVQIALKSLYNDLKKL